MSQKYLDIAKQYLNEQHKNVECAFVAGSVMRGEGKPHSDIDLVIIYGNNFEDVRRESKFFESMPIESFIHNSQSLKCFMHSDADRGVPSMPSMISEGQVIGPNNELAIELKNYANSILESGPKILTEASMLREKICHKRLTGRY